jgi:hypothetical protein
MLSRIRLFSIATASAALILGCDSTRSLDPSLEPGAAALAGLAAGLQVASPSNATATAKSETQIDLSWQDNASTETSSELYRSIAGENGTFDFRTTLAVDATTYSEQGLESGKQYCYRIRAVRVTGNKASYSAFSNPACATTLLPPPPPPPPLPNAATGAVAKPRSSTQVEIKWTDNSTNDDGFRIERSTDGGTVWSLANARVYYSPFSDAGRESERQVCYRVVAFNTGGDAAPSNTTCTTPPAAPTNFVGVVDAETGNVDLTWNDNSNVEEKYQLWAHYIYYPPCPDEGACDAGYYEYDVVIAEPPANSTSYHCEGCATYELTLMAVKDGGYSNSVAWGPAP